jgi:hypothetical protein
VALLYVMFILMRRMSIQIFYKIFVVNKLIKINNWERKLKKENERLKKNLAAKDLEMIISNFVKKCFKRR